MDYLLFSLIISKRLCRNWLETYEVLYSDPLSGSKVDSAFHSFEVDKMITKNFWELSGKK